MHVIAYQHRSSIKTSPCEHLAGMQASSRKAHTKRLFWRNASRCGFIKGLRTLVALIRMRPQTLKSLMSSSVKTQHQALSSRSCVLAENAGLFSVTPVRVCDCSQGCTQLAKCGASSLILRTARPPSCVSVRKRDCFCARWWGGLLDAQFVRTQPFTVAC